jgi:photosystem II stability/assembly factor-like uncharacterized protein
MGDLSESFGSRELLRCFNDNGDGWDIVGSTESPPDPVSLSLDTLLFEDRDWLEKLHCDFSLYLLNRDCGLANVFSNYVRGEILTNCRLASHSYTNLVMREEDSPSTLGSEIEAYPPLLHVSKLEVEAETNTFALAWNDVIGNSDRRCVGDCKAPIEPGEQTIIASQSAPAAATADVPHSHDFFATFQAAATDPFGAGLHIKSAAYFYVGNTTVRWLVGREGAGGAVQGLLAYSDNGGASWTTVNIGGAAVGHGPTYGGGIWMPDETFGLCACNLGYIYKSINAGGTWTAVEAGVLTAGSYSQVKADPSKKYCIAGAPADIISLSDDGGDTWYAGTATGGGGDILTCVRFNKDVCMVGTDDGTLWRSDDAGVTWTQITGWAGSGVGDVRDLWFVNDHEGFMAYNSVTPVGVVLRTINGGYNWEALTTPANQGLNKVWAPNGELAYVVGALDVGVNPASMKVTTV